MLTSQEFFKHLIKLLADKARQEEYIDDELIMIPELNETSRKYSMDWLKDEEFKSTFKGNTTGYYLGLCANAVGGGMLFASAWADNIKEFNSLRYDELYDGSVWENIFILSESHSDAEKTEFRGFVIKLFEIWVKEVYTYLELSNAGDYLIESFRAFFLIGAGIKLCVLGY